MSKDERAAKRKMLDAVWVDNRGADPVCYEDLKAMAAEHDNDAVRLAITAAYQAVEHALILVDAACNSGTADDVDGYPDDAQRDLKRALRALRAAERVFTPSAEDTR